MTIVERLRALMLDKGARNNEFARRIGVAQSTFQTWLSRNEDFPARFVMPICHELDVAPEQLLEGVECADTKESQIPESYVQLSDQERTLIEYVRCLDKEGMIVVTNKAVEEMRRMRSAQGSGAEVRVG